MFPTWSSGSVYIENVLTGNAIDVQGGVKASGSSVWPYTLNYTNAQIFRISEHHIPESYGSNARRIIAYPSSKDLLLSAKTPPMVIANDDTGGPTGPVTIRPDHILPDRAGRVAVADPDRPPSSRLTLKNVALSIEQERDFDQASPISTVAELGTLSGTPRQVWNILPVEGEKDAFYIEIADISDSMVIEPLDLSSGGTLVLSSFTGSDLQKWRILRTAPQEPTILSLDSFEWDKRLDQTPFFKPWKWHYDRFIKGTLSWSNPNPSVVAGQTLIVSTDSSHESVKVDPSRSKLDFKVDSSESAKGQQHCLSIAVRSRWQSENRAFSDELCRTPNVDEPSDSGGGGNQGVAKVLVFNCHNDRESVRLWTYDLTTNSGVWQDRGTLGEQWDGSSCPSGPPKEIALEDGHVYRLVAIDCGDLPPNQMPGTCHRLTSANILGGTDGATINFTIN